MWRVGEACLCLCCVAHRIQLEPRVMSSNINAKLSSDLCYLYQLADCLDFSGCQLVSSLLLCVLLASGPAPQLVFLPSRGRIQKISQLGHRQCGPRGPALKIYTQHKEHLTGFDPPFFQRFRDTPNFSNFAGFSGRPQGSRVQGNYSTSNPTTTPSHPSPAFNIRFSVDMRLASELFFSWPNSSPLYT